MRNFAGVSLAWLRRFFAPPALPLQAGGVVEELAVCRTLAQLETQICEGVAVRPTRLIDPAVESAEDAAGETQALNLFGQPVRELVADGGRGAIAAASGMTQTGLRAVAFLSGHELKDSYAALTDAAENHLPLILYAGLPADSHAVSTITSGQANLCAVSDCGAFVIVPPTPQAALDYALVARRIAEQALIPGLLAIENNPQETALLKRSTPEFIRDYLGRAADQIDCPTPAQFSLFAGSRRRVPKWFDADRPVALGAARGDEAGLTVGVGQRTFFKNSLTEISLAAMRAWSEATGRELSFSSSYNIGDADTVIVAMGKAIQTARDAAEILRQEPQARVGVLGIHWLRPFPAEAVRAALLGKTRIIVLTAPDASLSEEPPLLREVKAAVGGSAQWTAGLVEVENLRPKEIVALVKKVQQPHPPKQIWLGVNSTNSGDFPKREALLQTTRNDYPELAAGLIPPVSKTANEDDAAATSGTLSKRVRDLTAADKTYAGLARVWGELIQPERDCNAGLSPDPLLTLGAVPACSAACAKGAGADLPLPILTLDKCTACGDCWVACPDSAIGVSALGIQDLLGAAHKEVGHAGALGAGLSRGHKPIAAALTKIIAASPDGMTLHAEQLREAYTAAAPKLRIPVGEEEKYQAAFLETAQAATRLAPRATKLLYQSAEAEAKGSGALFSLAINPASCTGCEMCVAACGEKALVAAARTPEALATARDNWQAWEELPDTAGGVIARAGQPEILGEMAGLLLSRHCAMAQVTSGEDAPGDGERLALRLLVAVTEYQKQSRTRDWATQTFTLAERLRGEVNERLAGTLAAVDLPDLAGALRQTKGRQVEVGEVGARLEAAGKLGRVERGALLSRVELAGDLLRLNQNLTTGVSGLGRSRFGVLIAGAKTSAWAARFPIHPYAAPLRVDLSDSGADLARGIATGMIAEHLSAIRQTRQAELLLARPADFAEQLRALDTLDWTNLTAAEQAAAPALLLVVDDQTIRERGLGSLGRLLTTNLPIKIILLDGRDLRDPLPEPSLVALAHRNAYVLATSTAHPDHLASGLSAALAFAGPALIHLYAPQPATHGFSPAATLRQARQAVAARVQPLLKYDPAGEGVFGRRISLADNPAADADEAATTLLQWAFSEARYKHFFTPLSDVKNGVSVAEYLASADQEMRLNEKCAVHSAGDKSYAVARELLMAARERMHLWQVYRELAGEASPFVDQARAAVREEIEAQQALSVDALKADYETQLQALRADIDGELAHRLRERLRVLAGVKK